MQTNELLRFSDKIPERSGTQEEQWQFQRCMHNFFDKQVRNACLKVKSHWTVDRVLMKQRVPRVFNNVSDLIIGTCQILSLF